jgi:acyl-CoA thioester hydrolase
MAPEPAPLRTRGDPVPEAWVDYNGHVEDACYPLAFAPATTALLDAAGVGEAYRAETGCTIYTVECHLRYLRELHAGDVPHCETWLLGFDEKRIHAFHTLAAAEGREPAATCELLFLHVDQRSGRVAPFPAEQRAGLERLGEAQGTPPPLDGVGRAIRAPGSVTPP